MFKHPYVGCRHYGKLIELTEPLIWEGEDYKIRVPAGFYSDGFTNYGLHQIVSRFGKGLPAAVIHDYLVNKGSLGIIMENELLRRPSWKESTEIFRECLLECGLSKWRVSLICWGVNAYGFINKL